MNMNKSVTVSAYSGFCPGVSRADKEIHSLIGSDSKAEIYTMGNLIHNRLYLGLELLEKRKENGEL